MNTGLVAEKPETALEPAHQTALEPAHQEGARNSALWQWAALGAILLGSCGHLLIKAGVSVAGQAVAGAGFPARISHYFLQPATFAGLAIYGAGTLLWIYAVSHCEISFLYPLTALTYVIVAVGGAVVFGERISSGRGVGIAVVVLGAAMLQLSTKGGKA